VVIGKHECANARDTDLKRALDIGLDEALTAPQEAFTGLSDEQVRVFPLPGRNNIAWIVMHCLDNLDDCVVGRQTGNRLYPSEWRWDLWQCTDEERPKPEDAYPSTADMLARLDAIREAGLAALEGMSEASLRRQVDWHPDKSVPADFYIRAIYHTMPHVRQIWLLRGAMGAAGGLAWPRQHRA